jgi:hypothetical protein
LVWCGDSRRIDYIEFEKSGGVLSRNGAAFGACGRSTEEVEDLCGFRLGGGVKEGKNVEGFVLDLTLN